MGRSCFVLALLGALLVAPRSSDAAPKYYQNASISLPSMQTSRASSYRDAVERKSRAGKLHRVYHLVEGRKTQPKLVLKKRGRGSKLRRVPLAGVAALAYTATPRLWGAEVDLLVRVKGKGSYPVTIWYEAGGDATVTVGKKLDGRSPGGFGSRRKAEEIRRIYGTGRVKSSGRQWKPRELRILDGSLQRLHEDERRVLKGVVFLRVPAAPRPMQAGVYKMDTRGRYSLKVFNRAFESQDSGFVGSVTRPRPAAAFVILHEIGHAVAQWPLREASERKDVPRARRLQKENEVLAAYRRARGPKRGPTPYGRRSLNESFAESFALFHLDPAALKRWSPDTYRWFKEGGHRRHLAR